MKNEHHHHPGQEECEKSPCEHPWEIQQAVELVQLCVGNQLYWNIKLSMKSFHNLKTQSSFAEKEIFP